METEYIPSMSRLLTDRQADELCVYYPWRALCAVLLTKRTFARRHKSIIAYLSATNLPNTATALREELSLPEDAFDAATVKKYETLLEKKWTSIVRLQKKAC